MELHSQYSMPFCEKSIYDIFLPIIHANCNTLHLIGSPYLIASHTNTSCKDFRYGIVLQRFKGLFAML